MTHRSVGRLMCALGALAATILFTGTVYAQQFIYGNSASSATDQRLYKIDATTGAVVKTCLMQKGNGRGIVIVGNIAYYTVADSNQVFKADITTCADLGTAFSVAGATGLSTMAYDGTNFWIGDYSGSSKAYYYSPTGTLINTITLADCGGHCDGLEFFNGKLISNRGDASNTGYDVYSTSGGTPITPQFIAPTSYSGTGIAFDGTNFFVSDIYNQKLQVYNATTGTFVKTISITGLNANANVIEDLSADYQVVLSLPAPSGAIPTMSEGAMAATAVLLALLGVLALRRRTR